MQTLVQNFGFANYLVPATRSNDSSISAVSTQAAWLNLKGYSKVTWFVIAGAMTEADTKVAVYQAKGVSGSSASSTALAMTHYWTTNSSSSATGRFIRTTASSSKAALNATSNVMISFETDAKQLNANSSFDCVGLVFSGISAATCFNVFAVLHPARYAADIMPVDPNV